MSCIAGLQDVLIIEYGWPRENKTNIKCLRFIGKEECIRDAQKSNKWSELIRESYHVGKNAFLVNYSKDAE